MEKDIEVIVQDNFKFSEHCKKVAQTGNRIIGQVRRSFHNKEPDLMLQIYNVISCLTWTMLLLSGVQAFKRILISLRLYRGALPG